MSLPYVAFLSFMKYAMIGKVVGDVKKKMEKTVNLDQCQVSMNYTMLTKLLDHSFMCIVLVSMMKRTF